jgi:outer membrane protein assembly factor BamB
MPSRRALLASAGAALAAGTSGCATPFTGARDDDRVDSEPGSDGAAAFQHDPGHRGWSAASPPTEDPTVRWRVIVAPWKTVPVGTSEAVYVVDETGHLLKIDPAAGGIDWTTELARTSSETPALGEEILYAPARERGSQPDVCLGIDPEDGRERWRVDHGGHVTPVDGGAAVGGEGTEALSLVEPDGAVRWTVDLGAFGSPPAFAGGAITVGTEGGTVHSFTLDGT